MGVGAESGTIKLPEDVVYQPAWLTWVASTTTCLRAVGVDCDQADVAGFSGYAFHLCVHEVLCPSGPTALEWGDLTRGAHALGRATVEFRAPGGDDLDSARRDSYRAAFDLVRRELQAGRPCVLWGTYLPEFGVVTGVADGAYHVKCFKEVLGEDQPPIPFDATASAGGVYALGFPAEAEYGELRRDLESILVAIRLWNRPAYGPYRYGVAAYDTWIESLRAGRAERMGCGYNAACYAEGRRFAQRFFERMAERRPLAADLLRTSAEAYRDAADAMEQVTAVFPFDGEAEGPITDDAAVARATEHLAAARKAEVRAMSILTNITNIQPRG
jgi:hypothetical protein